MKQAFRNWFLCVTAIAALLSLTAATYAWFTSNQEVSTTRASARTAEESLELQISSDGSTFSNASPVSIAQACLYGRFDEFCLFAIDCVRYGGDF